MRLYRLETEAIDVCFMYKRWATPITLPIKYRDLPHSSQLAFTILDVTLPDAATRTCPNPTSAESPPSPDHTITDSFLLSHSTVVGGTTLALFGKKRTLRKGKQRCFIHVRQALPWQLFSVFFFFFLMSPSLSVQLDANRPSTLLA
jgi:hypothetical protein